LPSAARATRTWSETKSSDGSASTLEIIASHVNADFDALGSMVAARVLYPRARIVLAGGQNRNVHDFLALHEEFFGAATAREIDLEAVTRLVVVDTQVRQRLGELAPLVGRPDVEVILFDHHAGAGDIGATECHLAETGAAVTLLVGEIRRRGLSVAPMEATAMLLGVYEDTGCLTFPGTTVEDVETAAFLLRAGGELSVVTRFIQSALTPEQRRLLDELVTSLEHVHVEGVSVGVAVSPAGPYVADLALLAHRMADLESAPVLFVLARMDDSVYVVGRARSEAVDVGEVLAELGGGGHARAAAACVRGAEVSAVRERLLAALKGRITREPVARELMSVPARVIGPDASVRRARQLMQRYGHSGLSVVDQGRLVGIITRRDVDRAGRHRLAHAPVRGFMTRDVVTASPDLPASELEARMIERDVGRLPVLEDGRLVGVVTRSDLLRARHGARYAEGFRPWGTGEVEALLTERLPARIQKMLLAIGELASELEVDAFVVGGFVRDLLLGLKNLDVDVVVERDGVALAEALARREGGEVKRHRSFGTATVILPDGRKVDIATARSESYERPGALPEVEPSSIGDDLKRRDFTFNALAVQINPGRFGRLLDPFGGRRDLDRRIVRVLHALSFTEDPTRIFRAVRFEARLGFHMDRHTEALARAAVARGALASISRQRVLKELLLLFAEPNPTGALRRLADLGILDYLWPGLTLDETLLSRLEPAIDWTARRSGKRPDRSLVYLVALGAGLCPADAERFVREALCLPEPRADRVLITLRRAPEALARLRALAPRPSEVHAALRDLPAEAIAYLRAMVTGDANAEERIEAFLTRLRHVIPDLTGADLIALGYRPGRSIGSTLKALLQARLDGCVQSREDEVALARKLLSE
jgi:tRNA nucleotidyltransferase (CCA-adding enzyme)